MNPNLRMTYKQAITMGWIDAHDVKAIERALCSIGPRKGMLKKNPPIRWDDAEGFAAWTAIMDRLCPARVSVWGLMSMSVDQRAAFRRIVRWAEYNHHFINRRLQRPFEFNTYHLHLEEGDAS